MSARTLLEKPFAGGRSKRLLSYGKPHRFVPSTTSCSRLGRCLELASAGLFLFSRLNRRPAAPAPSRGPAAPILVGSSNLLPDSFSNKAKITKLLIFSYKIKIN